MSTEQPPRVDLLVEALERFAERGLSADLTPTMNCRDTGTLYAGFSDYMQGLDRQVRDAARRALDEAAVPVAETHRAEAWRVGDRFGWNCWDCTSGETSGSLDATAAERGAEWHSLHPHGLPEPTADGAL